jgi:hypothetical protein
MRKFRLDYWTLSISRLSFENGVAYEKIICLMSFLMDPQKPVL